MYTSLSGLTKSVCGTNHHLDQYSILALHYCDLIHSLYSKYVMTVFLKYWIASINVMHYWIFWFSLHHQGRWKLIFHDTGRWCWHVSVHSVCCYDYQKQTQASKHTVMIHECPVLKKLSYSTSPLVPLVYTTRKDTISLRLCIRFFLTLSNWYKNSVDNSNKHKEARLFYYLIKK